jgi:hypothetical protein
MAKIHPIELQSALKGVDYPARKDALVKAVQDNGASQEIKAAIDTLPDDTYDRPTDVTEKVDFGGDGN